ncbi:hypothetical protein AVEN_8650-1 [Araneus ventricosus]|uniref:Uncharacterized protein n=1 Tax=Araneus ventricosus TaxID=182803 RepID=A0A4Y2C559_ARAVE|nr:hypothetical protein AVEN_8650-1 [Araneus ventricosus]
MLPGQVFQWLPSLFFRLKLSGNGKLSSAHGKQTAVLIEYHCFFVFFSFCSLVLDLFSMGSSDSKEHQFQRSASLSASFTNNDVTVIAKLTLPPTCGTFPINVHPRWVSTCH